MYLSGGICHLKKFSDQLNFLFQGGYVCLLSRGSRESVYHYTSVTEPGKLSTQSPPPSPGPASMATSESTGTYSGVPTVIDDDVQRTAELILRREGENGSDGGTVATLDPEARRKMLEAVCVALQVGLFLVILVD